MSDQKGISRRLSLCAVMQAITNCGPISRASISKQTGLSKQTVSEIALQLETEGWIRETGKTSGHVGRSAVTYEIVPEAAYSAIVDLGGTKVRVSVADLSCRIIGEMSAPTDPAGGMAVVKQIARLCREAVEANGIDIAKLFFAVVGVPGVPDPVSGRIGMAPNIRDVDAIDFASELETALGVGVQVENDVNLAVLGEHWIGHGADVDDLAFVSLGTGIGSGLVIGGELVRGASGAAGELGYLPFGSDPFDPASFKAGALERYAGSVGIRERYAALAGQPKSVPEIFDLAAGGDASALAILEETARLVARAIATIGAVVNPTLVVLGGSIGQRPELAAMIREALSQCYPFPLRLEISELGQHAALIGGAAIGLTRLHQMLFANGLQGVSIVLPQPEPQFLTGAA